MRARLCLWACLLGLAGAGPVSAQDIIYLRTPTFRIPFQIDAGEQSRLREVQLYYSDDQGANYRAHSKVGPDQRHFPFRAERDGLFLFIVRTVDVDGRHYPPTLEGAKPGLRVMVDTRLPTASLRPLPVRGDQVGVEWEVRDDNLDLNTLQIEYRMQDSAEWLPLSVELQAAGQRYWPARGGVEVRLRVRDRADNQATAGLLLGAGGAATPLDGARRDPPAGDAYSGRAPPRGQAPAGPNVKVVNTAEISLNYSLEEVGPSGVSLVELWYTTDGRSWQRYGEDPDKTSPLIMKVNGEGTFGLTLVVKSGVGQGDRPPQVGDPPQMWVEVDLTKPVVQLLSAEPGRGPEAGTLAVTWTATDKNLLPQPVSIFFAEQAEGPWTPMATNLDNTGRFVWRIPPAAPYRFHVRVEAADRGGNIGRAETTKPVIIDLSLPRGKLLGVDSPARVP